MDYLLDTVTIKRHFTDQKGLGTKARAVLADPVENTFMISVISLMEIMYLSEKNRINISLDETRQAIQGSDSYHIIDLSDEILRVAQSTAFYEIHDRLILATAKFLEIPVISSDNKFPDVPGITVVWN